MAPPAGIEPASNCWTGRHPRQRDSRARYTSVVMVRRGGCAPPTAQGHGSTGCWAHWCPSRRISTTNLLWLAMPIRFSKSKRKRAWRRQALFGESLLNRRSRYSGPGDARLTSRRRTTSVLAGEIRQPAFQLSVANAPRDICHSWLDEHIPLCDVVSSSQFD